MRAQTEPLSAFLKNFSFLSGKQRCGSKASVEKTSAPGQLGSKTHVTLRN